MSGSAAGLGEVLRAVLRNMGHENTILRQQAIEVWSDAVGDSLANCCRAVGWQGDALVVAVADSVWVQELSLLRQRLIDAVNARLPKPVVAELRFLVRSFTSPRRNHARLPQSVRSDVLNVDVELPPALTAKYDAAAACDDPELQQALRRWLRRHFSRRMAAAAGAGASEQACRSCGVPLAKSKLCPACSAEWRPGGIRYVVGRLLAQAPELNAVELRRLVPGCSARIYRDVRETLVTQAGKVYWE